MTGNAEIGRVPPLLAALLLFAAGCASIPMAENPAPPEELAAFTAAMERANNPEGADYSRLRLRYEGEIAEMEIPVRMELCWRRDPPGLRETVEIAGLPSTTMLYDNGSGWEITQDIGRRELERDELQMILTEWREHQPEMRLAEFFSELAMDREPCELEGTPCRRLVGRVRNAPKLAPVEFFVGCDDHLIRRSRTIAATDLGKIPTSIDFSDYRPFAGLMLPRRQVIQQLGMRIELRLVQCEFDPAFADDFFTPREEEDEP